VVGHSTSLYSVRFDSLCSPFVSVLPFGSHMTSLWSVIVLLSLYVIVCKYTFCTRFQEIYDQEKKIMDCAEDIRLCPQQPSHQGWIVHRRRLQRLHMEAELTRRHRALEALTLVVRDDNPVVIPPDFSRPRRHSQADTLPIRFSHEYLNSETGKWQIGASANPMSLGECGLRREPRRRRTADRTFWSLLSIACQRV